MNNKQYKQIFPLLNFHLFQYLHSSVVSITDRDHTTQQMETKLNPNRQRERHFIHN